MRALLLSLVLCICALPVAAAASAPRSVTVQYGKVESADRAAVALLRKAKVVERAAADLSDELRLPKRLRVRILVGESAPGGAPSAGPAFFHDERTVHLPPSWVTQARATLERSAGSGRTALLPNASVDTATADVVLFLLYHELGHALVDELALPVVGREEDAVDAFAALLALDHPRTGPPVPVAAARLFEALELEQPGASVTRFASEHSLEGQRVFNIACWVYGADPKRLSSIVTDGVLPQSRADRCPGEYRQIRFGWNRLLAGVRTRAIGPAPR